MKKNTAWFRLYEELNDFVLPAKRKVWFEHPIEGSPSIEELVISLGIPPAQVDLILINGQSVDFSHRVKSGDRISLYPVFESFDISTVSRLRSKPLRELAFIVDAQLGQLASCLRSLNIDVLYQPELTDELIVMAARSSRRIILTSSRELLYKEGITRGYLIKGTNLDEQIQEVLLRFDLLPKAGK